MICKIENCDKPVAVKKRGMCRSHYQNWAINNKPNGKKPCTIEECQGFMYAKGMCRSHYTRFLATGDPLPKPKVVVYCICGEVATHKSKQLCKKHYARYYYHSRPYWKDKAESKATGYNGAHWRVRVAKGHPFDHACVGCGGKATDWALKADATDLHFGSTGGRERLTAYSLNIDDYQAMCKDCHKAYDAKHRNRNYKTQAARWEVA